ncbi:MAG: SH3 domain-containing protein [Pseudomonadota bacterium]|nr:SH3 domain-containing protein [Pseudomonadota bacterium]
MFFFSSICFADEEYFLTLRHEKVNLRQGPSFDYPIKIFYKKKFLPVLVQDKSDNFRKIRDHENNSGWIHISQLSKKKAAITIDKNIIIFKRPTIYSTPLVILEKGRLCLVKKCKTDWCNIKTKNYKGWVKKESLWGRI